MIFFKAQHQHDIAISATILSRVFNHYCSTTYVLEPSCTIYWEPRSKDSTPSGHAVPFHPSSGETPGNGFRWVLTEGYDGRLESGPSDFSLSEEEGEGSGR